MRSGLRSRSGAFTLVELLVAAGVFLIILVMTLSLSSIMSRLTTDGTASMAAFQEARTAFETMNRMLSQAVLNTYLDYDNPSAPEHYLRASELHFILGPASTLTGFSNTAGSAIFCQAPLSRSQNAQYKAQPDLLNTFGFYVRFSTVDDLPPFLSDNLAETGAWRLWMFLQPTERLSVYDVFNGDPQSASNLAWLGPDLASPVYNHVLANHVILLLIRASYIDASGAPRESYIYNSRSAVASVAFPQPVEVHQLPPTLSVTMVVIDHDSAERLQTFSGNAVYDLLHGVASGGFMDASRYREDLADLKSHLDQRPMGNLPIRYHVFETVVDVTSAKWSR